MYIYYNLSSLSFYFSLSLSPIMHTLSPVCLYFLSLCLLSQSLSLLSLSLSFSLSLSGIYENEVVDLNLKLLIDNRRKLGMLYYIYIHIYYIYII